MSEHTKAVETVGDFVRLVSATQVPEARKWVEEFRAGYPPKVWEEFIGRAATEESIASIIEGVSLRARKQIDDNVGGESYRQLCQNLKDFLEEIRGKVFGCGLT